MPIMSLPDQYDQMSPSDLLEQLELRFPERLATFEAQSPELIEAIVEDDYSQVDEDDLDELLDDIRELLAI